MKKPILFLLAIAGFSFTAYSTTVSISGGTVFLSDSTTELPVGSYLSTGYFSESFSDFSGLASRDWSDILATDYIEIDNSTVAAEGEWVGGGTETGIEGQQLYVWAFNSSSAPTSVNAQDFGLFTGSDAEWTAEGDSTVPPDLNSLSVSIVDNAIFGTDLGSNIALAPVPEPSAYAAIAGMLALGWVMIRRRQ